MGMKLLLIPLTVLLAVSIFGFVWNGSADANFGQGTFKLVDKGFVSGSGEPVRWFDTSGHGLAYENYTAVGEYGTIHSSGQYVGKGYVWVNESGTFNAYLTPYGESGVDNNSFSFGFVTVGSLGFLAMIVGLMALASIAGAHIFGSGISDVAVSVIIKGTAFLGLFTLASAYSFPLLVSIPIVGWVVFFMLSSCYTVGLIGQFGHGTGD